MATRPLGAQISHMLKDRGVDVIFGIPGVHNQELYRGIEQAGLTHILARHEQGAGFMADGYARATGKPGVAYVITGPGVTNIMTAMGQAYSDSVPLLVISSCLPETAARRGQLHQMRDQRAAAATVCAWSEEARDAATAYALIDRALAEFEIRRPRPRHLQVTIPALETRAPPAPVPAMNVVPTAVPEVGPAVALLRTAQRPVVIAGGGAVRAAVPLRTLADRLGAATFCTYAGRGVFPPDRPLHFGSSLARPGSADELARADVVLAIGTELAEGDLWRDELGSAGTLIRVDCDPEVLAGAPRAALGILADATAAATALCDGLGSVDRESDWTRKEIVDARARWRAEIDAERPGLLPVIDALREAVPDDAMIYSDMTQIAYAAKEVWDMLRPGHWHHPTGFGTLGYALPAAIGGAIARPGLPTLCLIGDYGLHYTMSELGVAVELGLPLPIVVWDNARLGEIEASMTGAQIAPNAVVARNPDFLALARAFGAHAAEPRGLDEIRPALAAAFAADRPTLIRLTPDLTGPV